MSKGEREETNSSNLSVYSFLIVAPVDPCERSLYSKGLQTSTDSCIFLDSSNYTY